MSVRLQPSSLLADHLQGEHEDGCPVFKFTSTPRVTPGPPRGLMVTERISSPLRSLSRSVV